MILKMEELMTRRKMSKCSKVNEDMKDEENRNDNENCNS
jgi:hypothetical protein